MTNLGILQTISQKVCLTVTSSYTCYDSSLLSLYSGALVLAIIGLTASLVMANR